MGLVVPRADRLAHVLAGHTVHVGIHRLAVQADANHRSKSRARYMTGSARLMRAVNGPENRATLHQGLGTRVATSVVVARLLRRGGSPARHSNAYGLCNGLSACAHCFHSLPLRGTHTSGASGQGVRSSQDIPGTGTPHHSPVGSLAPWQTCAPERK